ncbi:type VI secretion system lipoprotein TssJ [Pseudomonas sp. PAMC 29040]|uniref:type VI secretion system lipoprotein TssJ n=1 Tax=Pseudomonas sp. PAMC 29040 TaxID=2498450 RepID=UPI000FA50F82|nr:type VI secretion system lipoprotein TssJ [Pseudomonas sp. PAMC 29040]RUT37617.1 type VI secretion system lipoprotein TssJ [Pseudomonas sp. PAMC 29040]
MSRTVFNLLPVAALAALLGGCGLTQAVSDTSASVARATFYKQVKTLHLDFNGRVAMNTDQADMGGLSVPVMVRVYQLRDPRALERASYDRVLSDAERLLQGDLLEQRALVVKPAEGAQLSMPLEQDAQFVTVVALFRTPDRQTGSWRLTLSRADLDPERSRMIELGNNRLTLQPLAQE